MVQLVSWKRRARVLVERSGRSEGRGMKGQTALMAAALPPFTRASHGMLQAQAPGAQALDAAGMAAVAVRTSDC